MTEVSSCDSVTITVTDSNSYAAAIKHVTSQPDVTSVYISLPTLTNDELSTLLEKVKSVNGSCIIEDCRVITEVDLRHLTGVAGAISIRRNKILASVLLGNYSVGGSVSVTKNPAITTIDAADVPQIGGSLTISDQNTLRTISFGSLATVGELVVTRVGAVGALSFPSMAGKIAGKVHVSYSARIATVSMGGLTNAASLFIHDLALLKTFSALDLKQVDGEARFSNLATMQSITAPKLAYAGSFRLYNNRRLNTLCTTALTENSVVSTAVTVSNCPNLGTGNVDLLRKSVLDSDADYKECQNVTGLKIKVESAQDYDAALADVRELGESATVHSVSISWEDIEDAHLSALFANVTNVTDSVLIDGCGPNLVSIALDRIESVGRSVIISRNNGVGSLSFQSLASVGSGFEVSSNGALYFISAPNLTKVGGALSILSEDLLGSADFGELMTLGGLQVESNKNLVSLLVSKLVGIVPF
jgi:hypothetical protein